MNVVTGSTGFVGSALARAMALRGLPATLVDRAGLQALAAGTPAPDLAQALRGAVVYHLAALAHRDAGRGDAASEAEYDSIDRALPVAVALASRRCGARRLVFVSTAKVLGECSRVPLDESAPLAPPDAYSRAKAQAEDALLRTEATAGLEVVVVRPPLVYGPGVRANFLRLLRLARSGWPLPIARVQAPRSFVYVENLVDALLVAGSHPAAAGQVFHVTDGEDLSVSELVRILAAAMDAPCRLFPVPVAWLRTAAALVGRASDADRLVLPFRIDAVKSRKRLGWNPPFPARTGLQATAAWFLEREVATRAATAGAR